MVCIDVDYKNYTTKNVNTHKHTNKCVLMPLRIKKKKREDKTIWNETEEKSFTYSEFLIRCVVYAGVNECKHWTRCFFFVTHTRSLIRIQNYRMGWQTFALIYVEILQTFQFSCKRKMTKAETASLFIPFDVK